MANGIVLNDTLIQVISYQHKHDNDHHELFVEFLVDSKNYDKITTLLYEGEFDVHVPNSGISFRGAITQYSTSVTNLYKEGQVGTFSLRLKEVEEASEVER